ncbi:hypothetical protein BASA81_012924 [Batrachochytrium salamandrivorans]|nr:hypothetical protein BASA81_012924 [Batrachochytrium salamandrivorans]
MADLDELAEAMHQEELAMKKRLDEQRKASRQRPVSWQECIPDVQERRHWVSTLDADAALQKQMKRTRASDLFFNGPSQANNNNFALLKLLAEASKKSGVTVPRQLAVDLQKSPLPALYQQL